MSLIGKNVGNYRVIAKIGEGGMGSVYLGEHPMIGKRVAIKTLHPDLATKDDIVSRFFTEAKAVNDIGHPNIVDIVDFGRMPDEELGAEMVYFVMEFLDGDGLNVRLKRDGLSPRESIHIIRQCCSALAASHRKHIVHRDLKPENIYLVTRSDDKNYVKLLDFGIAKLTGSESSVSQHKTRTGLVIGTPAYMSPEQCEGKGNVDWRSDVYSLGVVFYEMLTGRVPFPGDGFGEVLVAHLTKQPELPSQVRQDVPAALEAIVMHAIEKDKTRRFQSMDEFMAAVDDPGAHLASYGSPSGRGDATVAGTMQMSAPLEAAVAHSRARAPTGVAPRISTGQGPRVPTGEGPRPTTLSGASGEMAEVGPGKRSRTPLFAAAAVIVVVGMAGILVKQRSDQATRQQAAAERAAVEVAQKPQPVQPQPKLPEHVKITIDSTPRGARIYRAGVASAIGTTPFTLQDVNRDEPDFDVLVRLDGFKEETRTVTTARDHNVLVALWKEAAPVAQASATGTGSSGTGPGRPTTAASGKRRSPGAKATGKNGRSFGRDDVMAPEGF